MQLSDGAGTHAPHRIDDLPPCVVASARKSVLEYPVATKRALRACLKAADICAAQPQLATRLMAERGLGEGRHARLTHRTASPRVLANV